MTRARILVAEDHELMRASVVNVLQREFEVVEAVANGKSVLDAVDSLKPDVCVLDISMPILNGIETANRLKSIGSTTKIIFLTVHDDSDFVGAAFKSGAKGYVFKTRMATDLVNAVREVLAGGTFLSPSCGA